MSRLDQRPYAGTWKLDRHHVTQQVPDLLVFVNGHNSLAGCQECQERLDIHQYITQVSVDASTTPNGMTGSLSLSIPPFDAQSLFPNGEAVLRRGLEIHIYGRGFFPLEGIHAQTGNTEAIASNAGVAALDGIGDLRYSSEGNVTKRAGKPDRIGFPVSSIKNKQMQIWESKKSQMQAAYPRERLYAIVQAAAAYYRLDPKLLWGTLLVESTGKPIGPNTEKTAGAAAKGDTGFGMAQTNLTQWTEIRRKDKKGEIWWDHADLYDPQKAIWTAAFLLSKYGVKTSLEARALWAGSKTKYQSSPKVIASAAKIDAVPSSLFQKKYAGQPGDDQFPQKVSEVTPRDGNGSESLPDSEQQPEILRQISDFPYYQIFHGVVTGSSWDESGGTRTGSLTIAGMMHFWENQYIVQQGSIFGANPKGNANTGNSTQHNYTGMTPHSIMWTLHKDVGGAAASVSWALNQKTNVAANNSTFDQSQYEMARLYWEKRFAQSPTPLRMYGVDGSLYSHAQQAFLAKIGSGMGGSQRTQSLIAKRAADPKKSDKPSEPLKTTPGTKAPVAPAKAAVAGAASGKVVPNPAAAVGVVKPPVAGITPKGTPQQSVGKPKIDTDMAKLVQFDPESLRFAHQGSLKLNAAQLQAFHLDLSQWGTINLFEATYQTKLEVANQVCEITGFEFYQDMDGDFVFKPPFYNLDTRESPVYCLRAEHVISFSEQEQEPTATYVTCTGSQFQNLSGHGLEGEFGLKSTYVDWRLVAQYGWREASFTSAAYSTTTAAYYAAVNRLDLLNAPSRSASCSIPFRPEIRPGYPVWVEHLDCFYYVTGVQHSFQFNSDATTNLTLTAKRARWSAPGRNSQRGVEAIDLGNPYLPARPLTVEDGEQQVRQMGFPNVVMTLDPTAVNPFSSGLSPMSLDLTKPDDIKMLVKMARVLNLLQLADGGNASESERWENGPWRLQQGSNQGLVFDLQDLLLDRSFKPKLKAKKGVVDKHPITEIGNILQDMVDQVASGRDLKTLSEGYTLNLLADRKASFGSAHQPGLYRYYSCSHPDPGQQGQASLAQPVPVEGFLRHPEGEGEAQLGGVMATRGIWVDDQNGSIPTDLIQTVVLTSKSHSFNTAQQISQGFVGSVSLTELHKALRSWFRLDNLSEYSDVTHVGGLLSSLWDPFVAAGVSFGAVKVLEFPKIGILGEQTVGQITAQQGVPASVWLRSLLLQLTDWATQDLSDAFAVRQTYTNLVGDTKAVAKINSQRQAKALTAASKWLSDFLETLRITSPVVAQPAKKSVGKKGTVPAMTTVFPVSDSGGYEVVGSYRYGRGLTIDAFGTFDQVLNTDPLHYADPKDVEELLAKVTRTTSKGGASGAIRFKSASDEELSFAARLASQSLDVPYQIEKIRKLSPAARETLRAKLEGWASKALDNIDRISPSNVGYSLAQIQPEPKGRGCTCATQGARHALDLLDPTGFVAVGRDVNRYLAKQYVDQEVSTATLRDLLTKPRS